jgi:hypothetical protein
VHKRSGVGGEDVKFRCADVAGHGFVTYLKMSVVSVGWRMCGDSEIAEIAVELARAFGMLCENALQFS